MVKIFGAVIGAALCLISGPAAAVSDLQFWHAMDGPQGEALQKLADQFNASQQAFRVVPTYKGTYAETLAAGMIAYRGGTPPHLLQVYEIGAADIMAERGAYKPLYQLAAETKVPVDRESYFPPAAAFYSDAAGHLLALPFNSSTPLMYYNRDAFIKAGLDPDRPPTDWYVLQSMLVALQGAGFDCAFTTSWQSWIHLENVSAWHNYPFASADNGFGSGRPELQFNGHLMIRHISLLSAWAKSGLFHYFGRTNDGEKRFARGECTVLTGSSAAFSDIARTVPFQLGVAPLPHYDDFNGAPYNTLISGAALWVMAGKTTSDYAGIARFMQFLASPAAAADWLQGTGYVPVTRNGYASLQKSGYYQRHPEMDIAVRALRGMRAGNFARGIRLRHFEQLRAILNEELENVWNGLKSPKSALDDAATRGNVLFKVSLPTSAAPRRCPGCR